MIMKTKLVEFLNAEKQNLRGVIVSGDIVKGGDHQMERPDLMEQWLPKAVDFLLGKR